jgi:Pyruvate/2-oxoacid:ferredoxin oxidoreductase delta subunit
MHPRWCDRSSISFAARPPSRKSQRGLDEKNALFEARRCLSCGNCFECDNCYGVCPDNAVIKLGPGERFAINLDYCKGCGMCAAECPCGAIDMVPEDV